MRTPIAIVALAAACGLAGCEERLAPGDVNRNVTLEPVADCAALERLIEETALREMRARLDKAQQVRPDPWWFPYADDQLYEPDPGRRTPWTTKANRFPGVEEADLVKRDGSRLFVLSAGALHVVTTGPEGELEESGNLPVAGTPRELLLDGENRLVVFSNLSLDVAVDRVAYDDQVIGCRGGPNEHLQILVVDVSDATAPRIVREEVLPGCYVTARRSGAAVRVIAAANLYWPDGIRFRPGHPTSRDRALEAKAYDRLDEENSRLIRAATLAQWLTSPRKRQPDGTWRELSLDCAAFVSPNGPTQLGVTTVARFDLDRPEAPVDSISLLANISALHVAESALYLAHPHRWWGESGAHSEHSYLHQFDISGEASALPRASGVVEGLIADELSMDEHEGYLRVATFLRDFDERGYQRHSGRISVLASRDGRLLTIGERDDLPIIDARFLGERGFVSSLGRPSFLTYDLSDPSRPERVGEIDLGASASYLHPLDGDRVLVMGRAYEGSLLRIFDLHNLARPLLLDAEDLGPSSSNRAYERQVFSLFPDSNLLAVPIANKLQLFWIGPRIIMASAALPMAAVLQASLNNRNPAPLRAVVNGDLIFGIADSGVVSARLTEPSEVLGTVEFSSPE